MLWVFVKQVKQEPIFSIHFPGKIRSHGLPLADFLERVLVDSHQFPLRNLRDRRQLFVVGNSVSFAPVLDRFEFQQTQVFALFPMLVGLFADVDRWPVRDDVRPLQQSARVECARLPVRPEALRFRGGSGTSPAA